jgi:hypothetical protein
LTSLHVIMKPGVALAAFGCVISNFSEQPHAALVAVFSWFVVIVRQLRS